MSTSMTPGTTFMDSRMERCTSGMEIRNVWLKSAAHHQPKKVRLMK